MDRATAELEAVDPLSAMPSPGSAAPLSEAYQELGHPLPAFNGTDDWELPIPATFVIDRDRTIRFADADPDYTRRADPADVLAVLREIT
jgi:peroxiredoxin